MTPKHYFDIDVNAASDDTGMSPPLLRGRLLAILHVLFAEQPETYAVAIPASAAAVCENGGGRLRVFASSREQLDALAEALAAQPWIRDYARLAYPRAVPADFAGPWVTFRRHRVPTLKADRHTGDAHGQLRQRRMAAMATQHMDYFILQSGSTGQRFSLAILREPGAPPQAECRPNSYGFCTAQNLFSVPDLP